MTEIKLSVVIGTYNQKDNLKKVLESLFKQTLSPYFYEIIVVDSMSSDGTDIMIEEINSSRASRVSHPALLYIRQENTGRPGARNRGINEAKGKIIFLTDADMLADANLLQEHLKVHGKKPNSAFEGITINPDNKPYIKEKIKPMQKLKFSYFLTGNLSIPRSIIKNAGVFDADFAGYGWEDIELGYRLSKLGVPLYYLPTAVNHHMHPVSQGEMFQRKYHMGKSAAVFYKKHPNTEIKLFLGMNPLAQGIYRLIKRHPTLQKFIEEKAEKSNFYGYIWEEFQYRKGLEDNK
ncbi:glycosyltransferase family 2 protein [Candidatus Saganbacteria bacterium]|nr:glycosyltransferase family 2 protein [Candidatus Saganbacteria bacterium]